jgi:hypothetical protein
MRIRYANEPKLRAQMAKRGWTEAQIGEALRTQGIPIRGKEGPATRYVHPRTGRSVVATTLRARSSTSAAMGSSIHEQA